MTPAPLGARTIEARAGSLAMAAGVPSASVKGQIEMSEWKQVVADAVAADPPTPLRLVFFGGANQIIGYRLYYMLQFAKRAGVRHLALSTDGVFWIDEATDWLMESGVDEIVLIVPGGQLAPPLADRVRDLAARGGCGARVPDVTVRAAGAGALE